MYPIIIVDVPRIPKFSNPTLDSYITALEIKKSIAKCKEGKASGTDLVNYSFYKRFPENWLHYLEILFNRIMTTEIMPSSWGHLTMSMLFKKGDIHDPSNYRPITLIRVSYPNSSVYVAFIDFKGAFDSVCHGMLWQRLHELGISTKMINNIPNFYESASVCIKAGGDTTSSAKVTRGVMQGEVLSSLQFILFISDFSDFLLNQGCRDLSIDSKTEVQTLDYADDI
ncbi:uncharacterized protein LOC117171091 [Belonocnema kinseyi]|uniref:uncharacterized protein LOC117171091 n=1 Tax=Belonocnema kinseyi TaxID=2817044 RepID=UPI00143D2EF0|nr:uncharacterized protein LOC117171091 [Belonocnema kinseyi]